MIGSPSEKYYGGMVSSNMIKNCQIDSTDVSNARAIFGPDLAGIRGYLPPDEIGGRYIIPSS